MDINAAVVTVSDRATAGEREDLSGPTAVRLLEEAGVKVLETAVVSDDVRAIAEGVQNVAYDEIDLIITTGGTGITPQDYTARAMDPLLRFDIPGIAEAIRHRGVQKGVPGALLSRGRAGVMVGGKNRTLVINLAGSPDAVEDGLAVVIPVLEHAIAQMRGGDH
ncbi:MogA/MoaB family molybdenum cofactor biosynthesis protein [Trueperella bialowiezensis]|uniref:Molybdenum cofactor biosynthesis protein B n=1 Tax=Trueperella bialowiezensis TaxID=312285 RepID=A0A448PE52_9ACTO|nr:molybdenum cofactor synthesis domain-containing protein [Trueperella bialowiezensis]VEI13174.1 Molybdenum cofactor biosynthesis protein B [Trueperella bialowiezensis]